MSTRLFFDLIADFLDAQDVLRLQGVIHVFSPDVIFNLVLIRGAKCGFPESFITGLGDFLLSPADEKLDALEFVTNAAGNCRYGNFMFAITKRDPLIDQLGYEMEEHPSSTKISNCLRDIFFPKLDFFSYIKWLKERHFAIRQDVGILALGILMANCPKIVETALSRYSIGDILTALTMIDSLLREGKTDARTLSCIQHFTILKSTWKNMWIGSQSIWKVGLVIIEGLLNNLPYDKINFMPLHHSKCDFSINPHIVDYWKLITVVMIKLYDFIIEDCRRAVFPYHLNYCNTVLDRSVPYCFIKIQANQVTVYYKNLDQIPGKNILAAMGVSFFKTPT